MGQSEAKTEIKEKVVPEPKLRFMVWFTQALERFNGIKPHHLHSIQAYFQDLGLEGPQTVAAFDQALNKFGYNKKVKKAQ